MRDNIRMLFEYEDGSELVVREENEGLCIAEADMWTEDHGDIVYYTEIDDDSLLYDEDGWQ